MFQNTTQLASRRLYTIVASHDQVSGEAHVTVLSPGEGAGDICGVIAYPVPYKSTSGLAGITFTHLAPGTSIRIFATDSRLVQTLTSEDGSNVLWTVRNSAGSKVASGVYFYLLNQNGACPTKDGKLVVIQ